MRTFGNAKVKFGLKSEAKLNSLKEERRFQVKVRVGNFLLRFVMNVYMPRSIRVVVLTTIGLLIATTALSAIGQVTGSFGIDLMCGPSADKVCPLEFV